MKEAMISESDYAGEIKKTGRQILFRVSFFTLSTLLRQSGWQLSSASLLLRS
jgi:hypothetical protein